MSKESSSNKSEFAFVAVDVEPCAAVPDGISLRFMCAHAKQVERLVAQVFYENDDGVEGWWELFSLDEPEANRGSVERAQQQQKYAKMQIVQDSGAGTVRLIYGGKYGLALRLCHSSDSPESVDSAESEPVLTQVAYLLLSENGRIQLAQNLS